MQIDFPEFGEPPVVEVAISLQFKRLEMMRSAHLGLLWDLFRKNGFSQTEDHGELEPAVEDLDAKPNGRVGLRVQAFDDAPPLPRVWFLNDSENELVQVQRDRLIVNWRQGAGSAEPYPRYKNIIERFRSALGTFTAFTASEKLGIITPDQCELTYVNHIVPGQGWSNHGEIDSVVTVWQNSYSDDYLGRPEDGAFRARYRMKDDTGTAIGRLNVVFQPGYRKSDGAPIFILNLTGRGAPSPPDLEGVFRLFDREHEWIV